MSAYHIQDVEGSELEIKTQGWTNLWAAETATLEREEAGL